MQEGVEAGRQPQRVALKFFYSREDFEAEAAVFHSRLVQAAAIVPRAHSLRRFGTVRPSSWQCPSASCLPLPMLMHSSRFLVCLPGGSAEQLRSVVSMYAELVVIIFVLVLVGRSIIPTAAPHPLTCWLLVHSLWSCHLMLVSTAAHRFSEDLQTLHNCMHVACRMKQGTLETGTGRHWTAYTPPPSSPSMQVPPSAMPLMQILPEASRPCMYAFYSIGSNTGRKHLSTAAFASLPGFVPPII